MVRRTPYSKLNKHNQIKADHVKGKGDVVYRGFNCLQPSCNEFIFVKDQIITNDFSIICPHCKYIHSSSGKSKFFDYSMDVNNENGVPISVSTGSFEISHTEYINESQKYKYCIVCNTYKPLDYFDKHGSRKSGRQGECRLCKKIYNDIKNSTRLTDQHRESAQKRRLLLDIAGTPKINSSKIEERYNHKCFCCGKDLSRIDDMKEKPLDHTLPVYYLWPLTTENATLLCRNCNGQKSGSWPSEFYNDAQLKKLSLLTGLSYELLSGLPQYNPSALEALKNPVLVDGLLTKYVAYMNEIIKLRNRILHDEDFDFFSVSKNISEAYVIEANNEYERLFKKTVEKN